MERQILHVDMDEFFAAVEKLDNPSLRGRCLLVGGDAERRGVVSTASYEARRYGCHSAMPMATAVRLCPQAVVLPVRGGRYRQVSEEVFGIFERYTPAVEPLSIDEAFLDVTGSRRLFGAGAEIAAAIRADIRGEIGLTASIGVAPNKFLAKLGSDLDKPDGLTVITPSTVREVLDPLPVGRCWGVGPAAEEKLRLLGIRTFADLRTAPPRRLRRAFGEVGEALQRLARGEDERPVVGDHEARSISQERTFPTDVVEPEALRGVLLEQVEGVCRRLRRAGLKARTVTLKLRTGDFATRTRSATLTDPTDLTDDIRAAAADLLETWLAERRGPLRLLGTGVSHLAAGGQLGLFDQPRRERQHRLDRTMDAIVDRFGAGAVRRGAPPDAD